MIDNIIDYGQPEAGAVLNETIQTDSSARLNYNLQDINAIEMGGNGELIITFKDSGQLVLANFEDFANDGNSLYFQDGTLIDPNLIASSTLIVNKPSADESTVVNLQEGNKYVCDFDPKNAATVEVKDGQMVLTFADGSQVVLNNYAEAMAGDLPAEITVADGTVVPEEELLTQVTAIEEVEEILEVAEVVEEEAEAVAQQVANIEPAAGEESVAEALANIEPAAGETGGASGNSGYGFNSSPVEIDLLAPDAIGPLGPTQLGYVAPEFQQDDLRIQLAASNVIDPAPSITPASGLLDETNLVLGNLVSTGEIIADLGGDGPGTITGADNFFAQEGVAPVTQITSGGDIVVVTYDEDTNTYTGTADGDIVFTMVVDSETGEYIYTQSEPLDHYDTTNNNEPLVLNFEYVVTDADGDRTPTTVRITVLDDGPLVTSQIASEVDETNLDSGPLVVNGQFFADAGQDVPATYPGNGNFQTSGEVDNGALTSNGTPVAVAFDDATNTYTGSANGVTAFTVVIDPTDGSYTYTQFLPLDHADVTDPNEALTLEFGVSIVDFDGDTESGFILVNVLDDAPVTGDDTNTIDEEDLGTGPIVITDSVDVDFGEDGQGSLTPSGDFAATGSVDNGVLSHSGSPITTTQTATGYAGVDDNGVTIYTLDIDPLTGEYTFTLLESLDHADDNDPNDVITLTFGTEITDFDGDTETGQIIVNIVDDAPTFQPNGPQPDAGLETTDETDLDNGPIVETGTLTADFGEDGPGTYEGSDSFTPSGSLLGGDLTSCGEPVDVTFDSNTNTYTGAVNGVAIFTLAIDANTGDYTYTQTGVLDHADGTDANDAITLTFGVDAVDAEGEGANGSIVINVADDAPEIEDAYNTVDESDLGTSLTTVTGDVTHNFGNDKAATVDGFDATGIFSSDGSQLNGALTSNGVAVVVDFDANTNTYTGTAGTTDIFTMVVGSDGSYTFELLGSLDHADPNNPNDIINLNFEVSATDKDGDSVTADIVIAVKDDVPTIGGSTGDVDETNLDDGPIVYTDTVEANVGPNVAEISPNGDTSSSTPLTSCGKPVTITQSGNTYTGTIAGGVVAFTLSIDPVSGQYTYTQFEPLDHPDSTNPDDVLSINFGVDVETLDGSTADAVITINVADDGPDATDDINTAEEGQFITGDVVANDLVGQDTSTVTNVNFNGTDYPVVVGAPTTIVGDFGTLIINADGTYNYRANTNDPDGVDSFTYTLTDKDGDEDTATLDITVSPDGQPAAVSQSIAVDETNLTPGPMIFNGDLDVDFGIDGAGTTSATDASSFVAGGSLANGALTSGGVPVVVTLAGDTYTGKAGTTTVFTVQINNDGTYQFQLFDHIDHADNTDPNDIITMEFGVQASDADGDVTEGTFTVLVHDDAPVAYDDGTTTLDEAQTVTGNVLTNDESSEDRPTDVVEVIFNGTTTTVPATGTVNVTGQYGVLTIAATGVYSYTANANNPDGTDTFTYVIEDFDGDQDTAEISFEVNPVNETPIVTQPDAVTVDDTDLENGPNTATGTIVVNYQGDGPGEVNLVDGGIDSSVALTSCGHPVVTTLSGNTYTGVANGETVFTMTVLEDGKYTFTQLAAIDHPNVANPNDVVTIDFNVVATDVDGDTATTKVRVNVLDDGPQIDQIAQEVYEDVITDTQPLVANGSVDVDFGEDGPGEVTANGLFQAKFQRDGSNVTLTSGGEAITVTNTDNMYTGTANGVVVFTLEIDPTNGDYTYTQFQAIDHPDATDPDDVIWLKFYVDVHDCDGDVDTGIIVIDVHDDGPVANNDSRSLEEGQTVIGNVISNDDLSVDDENCISQVTLNGVTTAVSTTGVTTVVGQYGTLTISADGSYSYETNNNNPDGQDVFTYTLKDADGDTDTATLTLDVDADFSPISISGTGKTDDTTVDNNGKDVETGTINVNYQGDGPGTTMGNNVFSSSGNREGGTLSHKGTNIGVTYNSSNNTYTGKAGSITVFTMKINSNGTYTFTQLESLDHSLTNNTDEPLYLKFGVKATDADGDVGTGTVTITVDDDGPNAVNDGTRTLNDGSTVSGNLLTNDGPGADGGLITNVKFGNTNYSVPATGTRTITTSEGVFKIQSNGAYTYKGNSEGSDTFTYTLTDGDGDKDTATVGFKVIDNESPISISGTGKTDDTTVDNNGKDVETGTINVNYQGDGPGTTMGNNVFSSSGNREGGTLSHDGTNIKVTYSSSTNTYTGKAGSTTVFTMKINSNGTYTFTQLKGLDHSKTNETDEPLYLKFGVKATDADGDVGTGTVTITVDDDGPTAKDDIVASGKTGTFSGNLLSNDDIGADGLGKILDSSDNTISGTRVYDMPHGTLTIKSNGAYKFVFKSNPPNDTINYVVTYKIVDGDGDVATAKLKFTITPLVLDLDGDGVELTSTQNGVMFDYDNDGELEQTAWVQSDDGFLVVDRNNDGTINDRSEMFGDMFGYAEGFSHLASLDSNNDGMITAIDDNWLDLQVWRDLNQDGISDEGELFGLDDLGIDSINVSDITETNEQIGDNFIGTESTYTTTDGETHEIADVHLDYDDEEVEWTEYTISEGDDFMIAAIQEAAESNDALNTDSGMTAEDVFFVDQAGSVDEAIHEFVASTTEEETVEQAETTQNVADNAPLALADLPDSDLNNNGTII